MRLWLIFFSILPVVAISQSEGHEWMRDELRACYAAADHINAKLACAGTVSAMCQESEDGGYSTLGMSMCNMDEYAAWDILLNDEYQRTVEHFTEWDADDKDYNPEFAKRVESLRAAQRAWIEFRDAECELAYAIWGMGSHRNIAASACFIDVTADRTVDLWVMRQN